MDTTKEKIKAIEGLLFSYSDIDVRVESMRTEIDIRQNDYDTLYGNNDNQRASTPTNQTISLVESKVTNKEARIESLKRKIDIELLNKRLIDNAMKVLNEEDRKFIEDRYFKKISPSALADHKYYCSHSYIFIRSKNIIKNQLAEYIRIIQ
ncbi:hypothetical protein [Cellulosilyticum lentocellum]|uniref:Phage transcriptional regulator, RinA family n=1 Tax=Cellulosilyticum lentocellum (strain ATCC 49066 / DSM 5427 / NCIMB 11756 / RHM5) TaxID=642492 RepID=F2JJ51_CELLD|nr:hypothetical protein [Cellulosilyticum lentocellum]ADZ83210.1 hypothetical protein Clole_1484 [Cellulosilyticum lentocellum DSM 5427]